VISRREVILLPLTAVAAPAPVRLIAHRGGVVDQAHPENSPASIEAAIERGYWMIEVDIRATKDGEPVLQHDPTFERFYGVNRRIEDLTWAEVRQLRANPGGTHPIHFDEACRMCRGKLRLMLDIKNNDLPDGFYQGLSRSMAKNGLLEGAYLLGGERWSKYFDGALASVNGKALATKSGGDLARRYFIFELGSELSQATYNLCRRLQVEPVAAINTFRYTMAKRDEWQGPREDITHLRRMGVVTYQIDSLYEPILRT
jgi:glycerophosphoryl diester phosphodiesterase